MELIVKIAESGLIINLMIPVLRLKHANISIFNE